MREFRSGVRGGINTLRVVEFFLCHFVTEKFIFCVVNRQLLYVSGKILMFTARN